jgi:hypothetical protein
MSRRRSSLRGSVEKVMTEAVEKPQEVSPAGPIPRMQRSLSVLWNDSTSIVEGWSRRQSAAEICCSPLFICLIIYLCKHS